MPRTPSHAPRRRSRSFGWTPRGLAMVIVGAGLVVAAYPVERVELLYVGAFVAAGPLYALALMRFRRVGVGVARRFSPTVGTAGEPVDVTVILRNETASRTPDARWRDELPWAPHATPPGRMPALAAFRSSASRETAATVEYRLVPPRRGVVDIGPFVMDLADPFGLARGEVVAPGTQSLIVAPALVALPDTELSVAAEEGAARTLKRRLTGSDDELMTREYRQGDPLRRVHWRATARHGELMVREEEPRSHAEARILLDTDLTGYPDAVRGQSGHQESDAFEWAVAFTGSLVRRLRASGFALHVVETAPRQLASTQLDDEFVESLARVELVDTAPHPVDLRPTGARQPGAAFAVVSEARPSLVDSLRAQRGAFGAAIAFVIAARPDAVTEPLRDAGWVCVEVTSDVDPVGAWRAALAALEVRRARA